MDNIIDPTDLALWKKAGKIAAQSLNFATKHLKSGASLLEVSEKVEENIISLSGKPAWPVQINLNQAAAHYCAAPDEKTILKDEVICIDVGVHIDGAVGDNAVTIDLSGKYADLVKASRDALNNAIKMLAPEVKVGAIGKVIEETIKSYGYNPVRNLSGHGIGRYDIHATPGIPNFDNRSNVRLQEHMIIAIEPFATDGRTGLIHEAHDCQVFMQVKDKNPRSPFGREVLKIVKEYNGLPFAPRWLVKQLPASKVNFALRELLKEGIIKGYPPLVEDSGGKVSQAEHTMYITDKGAIVLTKSDEY